MDTGADSTVFDKSLAPGLGKRSSAGSAWIFGVKTPADYYLFPGLSLGRVPLMMTGPYVVTENLKEPSRVAGRPVMGILGMDVLAHYCIQLDFAAGKIRFLDDQRADKSQWGTPFHLTDAGDGCCTISENLAGERGSCSLIDTGYNGDGWLVPSLFRQWTNRAAAMADSNVHRSSGVLGGNVYTNVSLDPLEKKAFSSADTHMRFNGIGIGFLSRSLVTLDFPGHTMYLKRMSTGPSFDEDITARAKAEAKSAEKSLRRMAKNGALPGWKKGDEPAHGNADFNFPDDVTFNFGTVGDAAIYHYELTRPSPHERWKLIKAWKTDGKGNTTEYTVP